MVITIYILSDFRWPGQREGSVSYLLYCELNGGKMASLGNRETVADTTKDGSYVLALDMALDRLNARAESGTVKIVSDSRYLTAILEKLSGYVKAGFVKTDGKDMAHRAAWERIAGKLASLHNSAAFRTRDEITKQTRAISERRKNAAAEEQL